MLQFFGVVKLIWMLGNNINIFDTMERLAVGHNFLNPLEEEGARARILAAYSAAVGEVEGEVGADGDGDGADGAGEGGAAGAVGAAVGAPPTP
jgi:hypothetical protein